MRLVYAQCRLAPAAFRRYRSDVDGVAMTMKRSGMKGEGVGQPERRQRQPTVDLGNVQEQVPADRAP